VKSQVISKIHLPKTPEGIDLRLLHLTLERQWFDMIASGVKRDEYREIKPHWDVRLKDAMERFDAIMFRNGYQPDARWMVVELKDWLTGLGKTEWGAPADRHVYILRLGDIIAGTGIEMKGK